MPAIALAKLLGIGSGLPVAAATGNNMDQLCSRTQQKMTLKTRRSYHMRYGVPG